MAGNGFAPKPASQRARRNVPEAGDWVELPAEGREGDPPSLPKGRRWPSATKVAWATLWAKPQATQWDPSGSSLHGWAWLHAELQGGRRSPPSLLSEMRQIEDRHGLSPRAMKTMRWHIPDEQVAPTDSPRSPRPRRRRSRLQVVDP